MPELCNSGILLLLNKDKIFDLHNSEILFSLKIPSYKKLMKNYDVTFYDFTIWLNSVLRRHNTKLGFLTLFSNSGIPDPYRGDEKLYKKINLNFLSILSYPHKGNGKNKDKHFNSNVHEEKLCSKERKVIRFIFASWNEWELQKVKSVQTESVFFILFFSFKRISWRNECQTLQIPISCERVSLP